MPFCTDSDKKKRVGIIVTLLKKKRIGIIVTLLKLCTFIYEIVYLIYMFIQNEF